MSPRLPTFVARRALPRLAALLLMCAVLGAANTPATATAAGSLLTLGVGQPAFVAGWDGESDSTAIDLQLRKRTTLTVQVTNAAGTPIRTLARQRSFPRGITRLWWDGRNDAGRIVEPGSYRIAARPSGASAAGMANVAAASAGAPVTVQAAQVSINRLAVSRGFLANRSGARSTRVRFKLSGSGLLSAAVTDATGRVVRNLHRGAIASGPGSVTWDGRSDLGRRVGDGSYTLLLAASAGHMPSTTLRVPLKIDTRRPTLVLPRGVVAARISGGKVVIALKTRASEHGRLTVRTMSGKVLRVYVAAGARTVSIDASRLGIVPRSKRVSYRLRVSFSDAAGNSVGGKLRVNVRAIRGPVAPPTRPAPGVPPGDGLMWPVRGVFTSPFGPRDGRLHQGIDIGSPTGTPIVAAASGVVSFAGTEGGYGNFVVLEHPGGMSTAYAHQSKIAVVSGEPVTRGQVIGYVGNTGHSTGPHLHFETRLGGISVDPVKYLPAGGPPA